MTEGASKPVFASFAVSVAPLTAAWPLPSMAPLSQGDIDLAQGEYDPCDAPSRPAS
jgi:hypothetical protein